MISVLEKIRTVFVTGIIFRPHFRTFSISKISADYSKVKIRRSNKCNNMPKEDLYQNLYQKEKRQCMLCKLNIEPDYKNVRLLSQFQSRYTGRIYGKHITGLCKYKQKRLEHEIRKAQISGLMGYWTKEPEYVNDPQLFDPNHPFRSHKY